MEQGTWLEYSKRSPDFFVAKICRGNSVGKTINRLAKGIEADTTGKYEKLKGLPKGLLPIGKGFKVLS